MSDWAPTLILAWGAFLIAAISPGPNMIAVAATALGAGRAPALRVALGVCCGTFLWAASTSLGLAAFLKAWPQAGRVIALIGGGYLLWLAARALLAAWRGRAATIRADGAARSARGDWAHGLAIIATNPKAALFWASVSTVIADAGAPIWGVGVFALGAMTLSFTVYACYAFVFSSRGARAFYARGQRWIEAAFGAVFGLLGARLIAG